MNLLFTEKQVPILMKHMKSGKPHSKLNQNKNKILNFVYQIGKNENVW